jgi:predicted CXXCH cytochrome family protein
MQTTGWISRSILLLGALAAVACTSSEIVYRDRPPFNAAIDTGSGLLGYYTASTKQTTCGNCHAGHQQDWSQTHHSHAFTDLVASGHATKACYSCHTVSANGNGLTAPAGWDVKADSTYQDVQCESCHGPGTKHVSLPDNRANWPLARLTLTKASASCAACHTGVHTPFAEEWATSGHAQIVSAAVNSTNAACKSCHDGKTVLAAWGVTTNYQERDSTGFSATTCAVCHNPHGSPNSHQLRFPIDNPDPDQNLCMKCHLRRGEPVPGTSTPHAPQGFILLGTGGYRPAGVAVDTLIALTTHASLANPKLCAGCHVNAFDVTDPTTGGFVFHSTGHSFHPLPCVDGTGKPNGDTTCAYTPAARTFQACTNSGCHANAAIASQLLAGIKADIAVLADQIWIDSNGNGTIDAAPVDAGYLAVIKRDRPAELTSTTRVTAAQGAQFNVDLFGEGRFGNGDKSHGVHNPFLARALLAANITELQTTYALPAPPAPVQAQMAKALADAKVRSPRFITSR